MSYTEAGPAQAEQERDEGRRETHRVAGDRVIEKVKEILHEGNVRRIIIKNDDDRTLVEIPLTVGVVGALMVPVWAAIGAIAAIVTNCSIEVETGSAAHAFSFGRQMWSGRREVS